MKFAPPPPLYIQETHTHNTHQRQTQLAQIHTANGQHSQDVAHFTSFQLGVGRQDSGRQWASSLPPGVWPEMVPKWVGGGAALEDSWALKDQRRKPSGLGQQAKKNCLRGAPFF